MTKNNQKASNSSPNSTYVCKFSLQLLLWACCVCSYPLHTVCNKKPILSNKYNNRKQFFILPLQTNRSTHFNRFNIANATHSANRRQQKNCCKSNMPLQQSNCYSANAVSSFLLFVGFHTLIAQNTHPATITASTTATTIIHHGNTVTEPPSSKPFAVALEYCAAA